MVAGSLGEAFFAQHSFSVAGNHEIAVLGLAGKFVCAAIREIDLLPLSLQNLPVGGEIPRGRILVAPFGNVDQHAAMVRFRFVDPVAGAFEFRPQLLGKIGAHVLLDQDTGFQLAHDSGDEGFGVF